MPAVSQSVNISPSSEWILWWGLFLCCYFCISQKVKVSFREITVLKLGKRVTALDLST